MVAMGDMLAELFFSECSEKEGAFGYVEISISGYSEEMCMVSTSEIVTLSEMFVVFASSSLLQNFGGGVRLRGLRVAEVYGVLVRRVPAKSVLSGRVRLTTSR